MEMFLANIPSLPFSVVSNMRINNKIRLQRFKDSFASFCDADIPQWTINIRGKMKHEAGDFLNNALAKKDGSNLSLTFFESENGWFYDTRQMLDQKPIDTKYIFYWIEDHICIIKSYILNCLVNEMACMNVDTLLYSFYLNGDMSRRYAMIPREYGKNIDVVNYDLKAFKIMKIRLDGKFLPYTISLPSFFSKDIFMRLLMTDTSMPAGWKNTPFAIEKLAGDPNWMPQRVGLSKFEIFCPIDDNQTTPGSCLIARNLYPCDIPNRKTMMDMDGGETSDYITAPAYSPPPSRPLLIDYFLYIYRYIYRFPLRLLRFLGRKVVKIFQYKNRGCPS